MKNYTITKNETFGSLEIAFSRLPSAAVRSALKSLKFRWNPTRCIWYGYAEQEEIVKLIDEIENGSETQEPAEKIAKNRERKTTQKTQAASIASLFERCDASGIQQRKKSDVLFIPTKDIAKNLRTELNARFPEVKFSIRSRVYTGGSAIDCEILKSPYRYEKETRTESPELAAVRNYARRLAASWNYDESDMMTDYFDVNFYGGYFTIASNYEQTTPTEAQKADIADFRKKSEEKTQKELEEKQELFKKQQEEQKKQRIEAEEAAKAWEKDYKKIVETVEITDIPEEEQKIYFMLKEFRKPSSLEECDRIEEDYKKCGDYISHVDAITSRRVNFPNGTEEQKELYEKFCNHLFESFKFFHDDRTGQNLGGVGTFDPRVTKENIMQLSEEQRESIYFFECDCVEIALGGVVQFIVNPHGFGYARYVYKFPGNYNEENDTASAKEIKKEEEEQKDKKEPFYFPDTLENQIKKLDLQKNDDITIIKSDFYGITTEYGKIIDIDKEKSVLTVSICGKIEELKNGPFELNETQALFLGTLPEAPKSWLGKLKEGIFTPYPQKTQLYNVLKFYRQLGYTASIDMTKH